jgi:hypothetical protein
MTLQKHRPLTVPGNWRKTIWPGFEVCVIRLVCEACVRLRTDNRRRRNWEERHYSWALVRHLEALCLEQNLSFSPRYDLHELTDEEFAAGESPKSAPLLDVCVRWHQHIPEVRFAIEAKILVVKTHGSYYPKGCRDEYVDEGMKRFLEERYARQMPAGAMLGYILEGTADEVTPELLARIAQGSAKVCGFDNQFGRPFEGTVLYVSNHKLDEPDRYIRLHHILVERVAVEH